MPALSPSQPHENQMGKLALGSRGLFGQEPAFAEHIQGVSHKFNCVPLAEMGVRAAFVTRNTPCAATVSCGMSGDSCLG